MKTKLNVNEMESRITSMFNHAVANEKTSVIYSDVQIVADRTLPLYLSVFKKRRITFLIAICFIILFPTAGYTINKVSISEFFNEIKQKLVYHERDNNKIVATVNGASIHVKDFVFYKANLEFIWEMNDIKVDKSNMDFLNDMIKEQLFLQYAVEKGYTITNEEVDSYIENLRNQLNQPDSPKNIKEIMQNRIKLSGLTEDNFWKSSDIVNIYRNQMLKEKAAMNLSMNGTADFEKFKDNLWIQKKNKIQIYKENLTN